MAVTRNPGDQLHRNSLVLTGSATVISETVTATGALDPLIPVSIINILGTATTVIDTYTLATASALYEGAEKIVLTAQTATDGFGIAKIEIGGAAGDPAVNIVSLEFPTGLLCRWINDGWRVFPTLAPGQIATAATAST